jgi:hypothetical protein
MNIEAEMFTRGPWVAALKSLGVVPFGAGKLPCNVDYVLDRGYLQKVARLVVVVCAMAPGIDANVRLTLRDPTGTIDGMAQRRALE